MTNLENNNATEDIHLNIPQTFAFIYANLPEKYARETKELLPKEKQNVDLAYIRQVKKDRIKNIDIINALYRVAQRHKGERNSAKKTDVVDVLDRVAQRKKTKKKNQ